MSSQSTESESEEPPATVETTLNVEEENLEITDLLRQRFFVHDSVKASAQWKENSPQIKKELKNCTLKKHKIRGRDERILAKQNQDGTFEFLLGFSACKYAGCDMVYFHDSEISHYDRRLQHYREIRKAILQRRVEDGLVSESALEDESLYADISQLNPRKIGKNMINHYRKKHSINPEPRRQNHRSKQISAADNKKTKRLQIKYLIKSKQSFNSQETVNREKSGLDELINHTANLQQSSLGAAASDLLYGADSLKSELPSYVEELEADLNKLLESSDCHVSMSMDPWTSNTSPRLYCDLTARITDVTATTPETMFVVKLLGMTTLKNRNRNDHSSKFMQEKILEIIEKYPALLKYQVSEEARDRDNARKENCGVRVQENIDLFKKVRFAMSGSGDNANNILLMLRSTFVIVGPCAVHRLFTSLAESFKAIDDGGRLEEQFLVLQIACRRKHFTYDRIGTYATIPRQWEARKNLVVAAVKKRVAIEEDRAENQDEYVIIDEETKEKTPLAEVNWKTFEALEVFLVDFSKIHKRMQSPYAINGAAVLNTLRVRDLADNEYDDVSVNKWAEKLREDTGSRLFGKCFSRRTIFGFMCFPIVAVHDFKHEVYDIDDDQFYESQVLYYLKNEVHYDENYSTVEQTQIDDDEEVSEMIANIIQESEGLNFRIGKRKRDDQPLESSSRPRIQTTDPEEIDPDSKNAILIRCWMLFHKRMQNKDSALAKSAISFDFNSPEEVKEMSYKVMKWWSNYPHGSTPTEDEIFFRRLVIKVLSELTASIISESLWSIAKQSERENESAQTFIQKMMVEINANKFDPP